MPGPILLTIIGLIKSRRRSPPRKPPYEHGVAGERGAGMRAIYIGAFYICPVFTWATNVKMRFAGTPGEKRRVNELVIARGRIVPSRRATRGAKEKIGLGERSARETSRP